MKSPCLDTAFVERVRREHGTSPLSPSFSSPRSVSPHSSSARSPPQSYSPRQPLYTPYSPSSTSPAALTSSTARLSLSPSLGLQAEKKASSPFENSKGKGSPFADVEANRALRAASLDEFDTSPSSYSKKGAMSPASRLLPRSPFTPNPSSRRSPLTAESLSPDIFLAQKYSLPDSQSTAVSPTKFSSHSSLPIDANLPTALSSTVINGDFTRSSGSGNHSSANEVVDKVQSSSSPFVASKLPFEAAPIAAAYSMASHAPSVSPDAMPAPPMSDSVAPHSGHMSHTPLPPSPLDEPNLYHPQHTVRGYYEDTSRLGPYYEAAGNMANLYAYSADALKAKTDAFVQKQRQDAAMVPGGYGSPSSSSSSSWSSPAHNSGSNAQNLSFPTDTSACGARVLQVSLLEVALSGPHVPKVNDLLDSGSWVATLRVGPTGEKTEPVHRGLPTSGAWEDGHSTNSTMSVPLVPSGNYQLVPASSSSSSSSTCLVAHVANPWQHVCLELHAAYRPSAATRLGLSDASPLLSLKLPTQDMRFMSAHLHHPQQDGTEHDDDENFKTNSLISRDGSVTIPDASSWSQFTGTLSFPGTNIKGADSCGVGSSSIVRCNATVSVRCSWAARAHTGSYGEVPALMPLFPSGRTLVLTILNPQTIPFALLREAEAAAAAAKYGRSSPLRVGKRRVTLGLKNNSMRIGDNRLISPNKDNGSSSSFPQPLTAYAPLINESGGCVYSPLQLSVFVTSPNDAVLLVAYDESDELITPSAVLASALVPYWDERFSGGLRTALYFEPTLTSSKFKSEHGQGDQSNVAIHAKASIEHPMKDRPRSYA